LTSTANDPITLTFNEFEQKVIEHVLQIDAPAKHAARSALRHLERAWRLSDEMPEISMFLAITAEEESASALFQVLCGRSYDGSEKLKTRNHLQKTALHPFLLAIGRLFAEFIDTYSPSFEFNSNDGSELLRLKLRVTEGGANILDMFPLLPLDFSVSVHEEAYQLEQLLLQFATEKNATSIFEYVKKLANRRNLALYASPKGIPHLDGGAGEFLLYRKSVIFTHFLAILLIDPYPEKQKFVQQALTAFLNMLKLLPDENIET
jgi:hypothetical protein